MNVFEIIRRPLITEKNTILQEKSKYCFEVDGRANKNQVKEAVEKAFKVNVTAVNIVTVQGKAKRMGRRITKGPDTKKAVVTLQAGQKIEIFQGV
jgi:large subunit ribosomal protein L23